jgi:hypothetical protein
MKERLQVGVKLFKRLLSVTIYNSILIYRSLEANKETDPLTFRLIEKHGLGVPHSVYRCPSVEPTLNN